MGKSIHTVRNFLMYGYLLFLWGLLYMAAFGATGYLFVVFQSQSSLLPETAYMGAVFILIVALAAIRPSILQIERRMNELDSELEKMGKPSNDTVPIVPIIGE